MIDSLWADLRSFCCCNKGVARVKPNPPQTERTMHNTQLVVETCHASLKRGADLIRDNITENDNWAIRALLAIYEYQTRDEQDSENTKHHNDVGFNGLDAQILTSFAKQVLRHRSNAQNGRPNKYRDPLSPKQLQILRNKVAKYSGQLARVVRIDNPVREEQVA